MGEGEQTNPGDSERTNTWFCQNSGQLVFQKKSSKLHPDRVQNAKKKY